MSSEPKFKQYIVVNRGLDMSRGKLMAQAAHASMAFLMYPIVQSARCNSDGNGVNVDLWFPIGIWDGWFDAAFTKVCLAVDSEDALLELADKLESNGFSKASDSIHETPDPDFFIIRDSCLTELDPDETGSRVTAIGFKPSNDERLFGIMGSYPLFR